MTCWFRPHIFCRMLSYFLILLLLFVFGLDLYMIFNKNDLKSVLESLAVAITFFPIIVYFALAFHYTRYAFSDNNLMVKRLLRKDKTFKILYIEEKILMGHLKFFEIYFDGAKSIKILNVDNEPLFLEMLKKICPIRRVKL